MVEVPLGEDLDAVDGLADRAFGSVSEPGEEGSQLRLADRIGHARVRRCASTAFEEE
ncbi:hypothetical protein [Frankia sp. CiP3]|uniref:hypothetical protein n=1 Tax=Frankia sp. CiP3 TaxID=2880971 RepID=UPI001EF456F2|nr:hypothetical protein [Frankia sp. CiP3]